MKMVRFLLFGFALLIASNARAGMELAMIEQHGCHWCERWNEEIAHIYPKSAEGQAAPLRRLDLRADLPADVTLSRPAIFTPTFILLIDGTEVSRIEGYPSEDFFWALLTEMIANASDQIIK